MSMEAAVWEEIGKIKDRLKALEIRAGLRQAEAGTMAMVIPDNAASSYTFVGTGEIRHITCSPNKSR